MSVGLEWSADVLKPPAVCGLILCGRFEVDKVQRQMSLRDLYMALSYPRFPSPPRPCTGYCLLIDGEGEGELSFVCTQLETERDLDSMSRWYMPAAPETPLHCEMVLRDLVFPKPGRYVFTLSFDGEAISTRFLDVRKS
jgi:hypothetical protein